MVRLIQYLCPERHCILACYYETTTASPEDSAQMIDKMKAEMKRLQFDPWCGICKSHELRFEDGATPWETLEEGMPMMAILGAENMIAAEHFRRVSNN